MSPTVEVGPQYHIDLDWYRKSNRAFAILIEGRSCTECQDRVKSEKMSEKELLEAIHECCAKKPDFITPHMSILETLFRLFLVNGNEPMNVNEMNHQLRQQRMDTVAPGPDVLRRLLANEDFYGLRPVGESAQSPAEREREE